MTPEEVFIAIYHAAVEGKKEDLQNALKHGSIDTQYVVEGELTTPIRKLAKEGNEKAIQFLGLNGASPTEMLVGLGMGNQKNLINSAMTSDRPAFKSIKNEDKAFYVIYGAAMNGHIETVNHYRDQYKQENNTLLDRITVEGYAIGKKKQEVSKLLENNDPDLYRSAILAYAMSKQRGEVNSILEKDSSLLNVAIYGYALINDYTEVNKLLQMKNADPNEALRGFAVGGHVEQVNKIIREYKLDPDVAIKAYMDGGHTEQAEILKKKLTEMKQNEGLTQQKVDQPNKLSASDNRKLRTKKTFEDLNKERTDKGITIESILATIKEQPVKENIEQPIKIQPAEINDLKDKIDHLKSYAELLKKEKGIAPDKAASRSKQVVLIANAIKTQVNNYIELNSKKGEIGIKQYESLVNNIKIAIGKHIDSGKNIFNTDRKWKDYIVPVLLALSIIGLPILGIKAIATGSPFFNKTERQKRLEEVGKAAAKVEGFKPTIPGKGK